MIHGIGTDLVEVARIERLLERFGERFVRRVLSDAEQRDFRKSPRPVAFLARRFAAKEAAAKALGTGIRGAFALHAIEVSNRDNGAPELHFTGPAARAARERGVGRALVSLSDERAYALAYVLLLDD